MSDSELWGVLLIDVVFGPDYIILRFTENDSFIFQTLWFLYVLKAQLATWELRLKVKDMRLPSKNLRQLISEIAHISR